MDRWLREHLGKRVRLVNPQSQFAVEGVLMTADGDCATVKLEDGNMACVRLSSVPLLIGMPPKNGLVAARSVPHAVDTGRAK